MWSEEWDNKFRDAAGQENKNADPEKGWQRMEPLLDKHLPQKQRGFTLLLLFLIAGLLGTAILLQSRTTMREEKLTHQPDQKTASPKISESNSERLPSETTTDRNLSTDRPKLVDEEPETQAASATIPFNIKTSETVKSQKIRSSLSTKTTTGNPVSENGERIRYEGQALPSPTSRFWLADNAGSKEFRLLRWPYGSVLKNLQQSGEDNQTISNEHLRTNPLTRKASSASRWSISLLGGTDISAARWSRAGEWRSAWGLAIGYDIRPNLTLRAGLIRSRKIYTAGPDDYKMYDQFWTYASELNKVDANCLVYEIPVSLLYHFRSKGKGNWFTSAGFASVLMKKEDYEFDYKDLAGQQRYSSRSWSNYSNHILAAVQLSGGYRYPLSKKFSISAEPYLKIPVTGIGYGDVKLRGAGMLISLTYR
jgi:hypothetical protein